MGKARLKSAFENKQNLLNIYFTAGFPTLGDTRRIMKALQDAGADLIEIGMPYSDPIADGPTIQESNQQALENGMNLRTLFQQLEGFRDEIDIPVVLMGYLNPVVQYGVERFLDKCAELGIDGTILPDMPVPEFLEEYRSLYEARGLSNIFLITPQTSPERIRQIDDLSSAFIYMVSSNSITGAKAEVGQTQVAYFERIRQMELKTPTLIGFGISNHETYRTACKHANGAIIGSAFIKLLEKSQAIEEDIHQFVESIKNG